MDLETLKDWENEYMKELVYDFIAKLKKDYPYFSTTFLNKAEAMQEFFEWFKNREVK